jgi:hypothetical protein
MLVASSKNKIGPKQFYNRVWVQGTNFYFYLTKKHEVGLAWHHFLVIFHHSLLKIKLQPI